MALLIEFTVEHVGRQQTTAKRNRFVECETDIGLIAVWGDGRDSSNIRKVRQAITPFRVRSSDSDSPNASFPKHSYWIPQHADLEIESDREPGVAKARARAEARRAARRGAAEGGSGS
jgi:hypothetical protein